LDADVDWQRFWLRRWSFLVNGIVISFGQDWGNLVVTALLKWHEGAGRDGAGVSNKLE